MSTRLGIWLNSILQFTVRVFWMRFALESLRWVKQITHPNVRGLDPVCSGLEGNKKAEKGRIHTALLNDLGHWSYLALRETYTTSYTGSQAFGLGLEWPPLLGFQITDNRSQNVEPPQSNKLIPYNKFLFLSPSLSFSSSLFPPSLPPVGSLS